jgi:hypothetical protein
LSEQYAYPNKGRKVEEFNFRHHLKNKVVVKPFLPEKLIEELTDQEYHKVDCPNMDYTYDQLYKFCDTRINRSASPGYPLAHFYPTNQILWEKASYILVDLVHERLQLLMHTNFTVLPTCPIKLWKMGLRDICRTFIKTEALKRKKIDQGLARLISSIGVVDSLCEKFLFQYICESNVENWRDSAAKPGLGFTDEHNEIMIDYVNKIFDKIKSSDMEGYDWSILRHDHEAYLHHCIYRTKNPSVKWLRAVRVIMYCIIHQLYAFSDGTLFVLEQLIRGIQTSGQFNTTSTNTFVRILMTKIIQTYPSFAAGDDCNEKADITEQLMKILYLMLGKKLKESVEISKDEFEFCSHIYNRKTRTATPLNAAKALFNALMNNNPLAETLMQLEVEFRAHPNFKEMCDIICWLKTPAVLSSLREYMGQSEEININNKIIDNQN